MFKLTVYRKVNMSRNFFLLVLMFLLVLVGGKIMLAHEKIATYEEAMKLYRSGDLVAAEKKFRAAKLNVVISDHNKEINQILGVLSPIRETMEELDKKAGDYYNEKDLPRLADTYNSWQEHLEKWVGGTAVQKDMYEEMLTLTKLDKDLNTYFSAIKKAELAKLTSSLRNDEKEEQIHKDLNLIPSEYYGGDSKKTELIKSEFQKYYSGIIKAMITENDGVFQLVDEGNRQFSMLKQFSIDSLWLKTALETHLIKVMTEDFDKKEYALFAEKAKTVKDLSSEMADSQVFPWIEKRKNELLNQADKLTVGNKYEEAISLYEALRPLEDTEQLIKSANLAWDKFEPIRVLKRLYPDKEFPHFVNARNKWGADSAVAAISKEGLIYFGKLNGEEEMSVTTGGNFGETLTVNKLDFQGSLSLTDVPVLFIDAKSSSRKHRYMAYEVVNNSVSKILDVEADSLTIESKESILLENPVGQGAGEFAYYERGYSGGFQFSKIKVDYIDISAKDIKNYYGQKVRFTTYSATQTADGPLIKLSETYNFTTRKYESQYLLLKGQLTNITNYNRYTVIGVFNSYQTITDSYGEPIEVPVFQVEKVE
ncbi:hypothetical protein [Neobacillus niacini]|uniref:hypothetical protein n=1 Tax=Neobacillus niacini TaxID=86668 RepID=UPI0021CB358F|nr:hypothetical protein [Neobacillus niacini]MCM3763527.1 hypothetical protein [Neobacillus niacini]